MLGHEEEPPKSGARAQTAALPNSGNAFSTWSKAIGYWMYLIGPCRDDFQAWFLSERQAHCGFSATEEQITSAWSVIREQISGSIHQFADAHGERQQKGRAAFMQMLAAQMQVEERFVHLFREELLPYIKERNDPLFKRAMEEVTVAGPGVLGVLGQIDQLVTVFNLIEAKPPAKANKEEERADMQLSQLLNSILSGNKAGQSFDLSDINDILRSPGSRMMRKHEGVLSKCEELAIYCTPLGPLFFMAQGGSLSEVTSLMPVLSSEWQTSALARHILALAYKRAGKIAAGRGMAGLHDALAHWTAAIDKWRQQEAEKRPRTAAGPLEFLERRLSGMITRERDELVKNIHNSIKSACMNRINTAKTQKDWPLLDEPLQYINRAYQLLNAQGLSSVELNGFYALTLRDRALLRYQVVSAEKALPVNEQITLLKGAQQDLLRAAEVYPIGAAHYKNEAAILSANIANILYQQGDSEGAERELRQAINLSADKSWKNDRKKDLATVLHNRGVTLYNKTTDANRSIALLEEAQQLDPSSKQIQEHLATLKQIRDSARAGRTYNTGGALDSDKALEILEEILKRNPSDRQAREYLEALKRMKGKGW
jgi:tetratricopeptide (TPR) repeat protein